MMNYRKLSRRIGVFSIASLACATLFSVGCSIHEESRRGLAQDSVTHFLAGVSYLALLGFLLSGVAFIFFLAKEK